MEKRKKEKATLRERSEPYDEAPETRQRAFGEETDDRENARDDRRPRPPDDENRPDT